MQRKLIGLLFLAVLSLLTACGGGGGAESVPLVISGTVSKGAVLPSGTIVSLKDAKGVERTVTMTSTHGSYSIVINGLTAPFLIKVDNYFSFALGAGTVNINPLTDVAVRNALGAEPSALYSQMNAQQLQTIKNNITARVQELQTKLTLLYSGNSIIQQDFMGGVVVDLALSFDMLFDNMQIQIDTTTGTITITQNGQTMPFMTIIRNTAGGVDIGVNTNYINAMAATMATVFKITPTTCKNDYAGAAVSFNLPGMVGCTSFIYCQSLSDQLLGYYLIKGTEVPLNLSLLIGNTADPAYLVTLAAQITAACK